QGGWFHPFQDVLARVKLVALNLTLNDLPGLGLPLAIAGGIAALIRRSGEDVLLVVWLALLGFLFLYAAFPMTAVSFLLPGLWILALFAAHGLARVRDRWLPVAAALALLVVAAPWARLWMPKPPKPIATRSAASVWTMWPEEWSPFRHDKSW